MNVKQVIETQILDSGMDGEGIARVDGKVVFIPYALKGEVVRAVVKSVNKKFAFAEVIKVLTPSPHRVVPECPHYYKCGGCDCAHFDDVYRAQALTAELVNNLDKIAGISFAPTAFVMPSSKRRNKIAMPFGYRDGRVELGMYRYKTHTVEPVDCMLAGELTRAVARTVASFADDKRLSVYDEASGRGLLRHLVVREAGGRAAAVLVVNGTGLGGQAERELAAKLPTGVDLFIGENTRRTNVIFGDGMRLVKGNAKLAANVLDVDVRVSPQAFFQVNDEIRDRLYEAALAGLFSPVLVDLYSGIGITSNLAARRCEAVYAVECVPQAVKDADETAALNGNSARIHNICGDVEKVLPGITCGLDGDFDVLVDPPRKGCGAEVMNAIAAASPRTLVYISCNHATMCRDIRTLLDASPDYSVTDIKIFDMFPCTHHCETLCVLSHKKRTDISN